MSEQNTKALNNEAKAENTAESPATPSEIILEDTVSKKKFRKKIKKQTVILIAVLFTLIAILAGRMLNKGNDQSLQAATYTLSSIPIEQTISANGLVSGSDSAEIGTSLGYEFIAINVKEGDRVKKGDILGVLDNKTLQSDYDMALKDVEIAKKQIEEQRNAAKLALEERQIDYEETKRQNEIAQELFQSGGISNDELVQANIALDKASFALKSAKDALDQMSDTGTAALSLQVKQEILETKKDNLDKANITSPIDGTVTRVNAKLGRIPSMQDQVALFIVENLDDLIIEVNISEYDISKVEVGQSVTITSDVLGLGNTIEGVVSQIAPTGEVVAGAGTKEMRIPVEIQIVSKDSAMIAGVNAKANIQIAQKENALAVPLEALAEDAEGIYILLGNDGLVKKIYVQTGIESISNIEIISDEIKAGDLVILNPTSEIMDGSPFTAME